MLVHANDRILFTGDSITDCGRNREKTEDLNPKIDVMRKLAVEFGVELLPLDGLFAQAATQATAAYWAEDGVHPTAAGHALIAETWLENAGVA